MATIRQKGNRIQVIVRLAGHPTKIRYFPLDAHREAEAWADVCVAALGGESAKGGPRSRATAPRMPQERPQAPQASTHTLNYPMTLGQALARFRKEVVPTMKGAHQLYNRVDLWLRERHLCVKRLVDITQVDLTGWRKMEESRPGVGGRPRSPSTIHNKLSLISSVYIHARYEWGMPDLTNPVKDVRKPKNRRPRDVRLTADQRDTLWAELYSTRTDATGYLYHIARLAALTAMRLGELREQAVWDRWEGRVLCLEDTKNGERRNVPLSSEALALLTEWWEMQGKPTKGRVFPYSDDQVRNAYKWRITTIRKRDPSFPNITFHDLRHIAATDLSKKLSNVLELSAVTGHRSLQVLKRYYNPDPHELAMKLG